VGLVARVDDRARGRGRARDLLADVLGPLGEAVVEAARGLEHLAGAREDLPGDEEGDERLGQPLEAHVPAHEVVLVAAVRIARRVGVVLEQVARDVVGAQAPLAVQGAGEAVLVLETEDPTLHRRGGSMPALSLARLTAPRPGVARAPPGECAGTCAGPSSGRGPPPRGRARRA